MDGGRQNSSWSSCGTCPYHDVGRRSIRQRALVDGETASVSKEGALAHSRARAPMPVQSRLS